MTIPGIAPALVVVVLGGSMLQERADPGTGKGWLFRPAGVAASGLALRTEVGWAHQSPRRWKDARRKTTARRARRL